MDKVGAILTELDRLIRELHLIWTQEKEDRREKGAAVTIGMYRNRTVFGKVKVREVMELDCEYAYGLVAKTLDDGRPGIELTMSDGEKASFGAENVAYVRFG